MIHQTTPWTMLSSQEDASVNFIKNVEEGKHETRYVRREERYFIAYLSSHNGCKMACRFCFLTQKNETSFLPATIKDYIQQIKKIFEHYQQQIQDKKESPAQSVHINFMARGEPLANILFLQNFQKIKQKIEDMADILNLQTKFKISTILPLETQKESLHTLYGNNVSIYYSLYSLSEKFRKRWLPFAMDGYEGLQRLQQWQKENNGNVVLHWPLIHNENDHIEDAHAIGRSLQEYALKTRFNLVRYNPYSPAQQEESPEKQRDLYISTLEPYLYGQTKKIPRVGHDVSASCGMFI